MTAMFDPSEIARHYVPFATFEFDIAGVHVLVTWCPRGLYSRDPITRRDYESSTEPHWWVEVDGADVGRIFDHYGNATAGRTYRHPRTGQNAPWPYGASLANSHEQLPETSPVWCVTLAVLLDAWAAARAEAGAS